MHSIVSFFWGGGAGGYKQGNKLCEKIQIGITTGRLQTAGLVSADPSVCAFLVRQTAPTSVCQPVCPSCPVFVHVVKTILVPVLSACVCVESFLCPLHVQVYRSPFVPPESQSIPAPASCPRSTSFSFVTLSSFLAPRCSNQFLTSDLCVLPVCFPYPLSLLFVPLSPLLVSEHPPPLLLYLGARWQALLQLLLAPVHLETRGASARAVHFVFLSLHPLCTLLAQFDSDCAPKTDGRISVRIWAKIYLCVFYL